MVKLDFDKSKDHIVPILCISCKNNNRHKVLTSVDAGGSADMGYNDWFYWNNTFQVVECQGCGTISFRSEHSNSEEYDDEGHHLNVQVYPKRTTDTWDTKDFYNLPQNLRRIYRETIDCYNNENLTLCGAGVRALVEGLCQENNILDGEVEIQKDNGITERKRRRDLQGKINGLYEHGKLTKDSAEILHEHRFLGNTAIHELAIPSKEELSLALQIVENVFDTLYEIPQKAIQLKYQRMKRKK